MQAKRVLIVGGGSAGWSAAAYLNAALNGTGRQTAEISLIESPDVPRIGVGEATIPNINHILRVIGIDENDFLRAVDGTFKQSIRYVDWLHGQGEHYHHPFSQNRMSPLEIAGQLWLQSDRSIPYMETISAQPIICELNLAPKMLTDWDFGPPLTYAYHMNALKFADYLRDHSTARGVTHHLDHVTDIGMAENGDIANVKTKSGQVLEADLFIDCTGFASIMIEKKLGVDFVDCSQWLLCDQAVTMHVPYEHHYPGYVRPYTTATALSNGWVWEIPMQTTRSLGYVHSSSYIDNDAAEAELRRFEGSHADDLSTNLVKFRVGHRAAPWVGNCISIGLAAGFIEPLESTGLYLSHMAAVMLAEYFPHAGNNEAMAFRFNRIMTNRFYEILDFINMHYCLTKRTDTEFWREVQKRERITDRLQAKFDFWKLKPPSVTDFEDQYFPGQSTTASINTDYPGDHRSPIDTAGLWNHSSYEAILYGMDAMREQSEEWYGTDRPRTAVMRNIIERLKIVQQKLPPHDEWLRKMAGMRDYR
jgi:tryptophan halogenase